MKRVRRSRCANLKSAKAAADVTIVVTVPTVVIAPIVVIAATVAIAGKEG
jgi:hypothetical protein